MVEVYSKVCMLVAQLGDAGGGETWVLGSSGVGDGFVFEG